MAKAYADGYNKEYQQIAYDAFLCGYGAKCESFVSKGLEEAANKWGLENQEGFCTQSMKVAAFKAGAELMKAKMLEEAKENQHESLTIVADNFWQEVIDKINSL